MRTLFALLALLAGPGGFCASSPPPVDPAEEAVKLREYATVSADEERGFTRKPPPKPGEWLYSFAEHPEPFERYRGHARIRPTAGRRTIVLLPLGDMNDEQKTMLEDLRAYAEIFFQLPARIDKPIELKLDAAAANAAGIRGTFSKKVPMPLRRGVYETQYNADMILDSLLVKHVPKDAVVCLGITMEDLYSGDLNYVFGLGSVAQRVGVYSLVRYFPEFWNQPRVPGDTTRALLRACKVLNHEIGHMFGLPHCVFYNCSMNGTISLQETDMAPVHYCPLCQRKLLWNTGCDNEKRLDGLRAFYLMHGLRDDAEFMAARLADWRKTAELDRARRVTDE